MVANTSAEVTKTKQVLEDWDKQRSAEQSRLA